MPASSEHKMHNAVRLAAKFTKVEGVDVCGLIVTFSYPEPDTPADVKAKTVIKTCNTYTDTSPFKDTLTVS